MKTSVTLSRLFASPFKRPRVLLSYVWKWGDGITKGMDYSKEIGDQIIKMFQDDPNLMFILVTRRFYVKGDETPT